MTKKAFTLIELSIVLIIIGLLVGGVLAGRELIEQAQLRATASQLTSYDTAINVFTLKYGDIPGDIENATDFLPNAAGDGNGDGLLPSTSDGLLFWNHLSEAGLIEGSYTGVLGTPTANWFNPDNIPASAYKDGYYMLQYITGATTYYGLTGAEIGNMMSFGQRRSLEGSPASALLSGIATESLDLKLDDGFAGSGRFWAQTLVGNHCVENDGGPTSVTYILTDTVACRVWWRLKD